MIFRGLRKWWRRLGRRVVWRCGYCAAEINPALPFCPNCGDAIEHRKPIRSFE